MLNWARELKRVSPRALVSTALTLLLLLVILVMQAHLVGDWRVDDAYITFSFSKNLGLGRGPIYSHDVRVEGYSNFLWMVLMAVGYAFNAKIRVYLLSRVLAYLFLLGLGAVVYRFSRRQAGAAAALASVSLLFMTTDVTRAVLSGLETIPYASLLTLAFWLYVREPPRQRRWSLFAFVAVALMRIDGCVPLAFIVGFEFVAALVERRFAWRAFARWLLPPLALYAVYFLWRWGYYHLPLPATYYAKSMVSLVEHDRGPNYVWDALRESGFVAAVPFIAIGLLRRPSRSGLLLVSFAVGHALYVARVGGDWMPFNRFLLPSWPLWLVLLAWGMDATWQWARAGGWPARALTLVAGLLVVGFLGVRVDAHHVDTEMEREKLGTAGHVGQHTRDSLLKAAPLLRYITRQPGETLATDYAGVLALYTEASVIDMWGLCNARIATEGTAQGINPIYGKTCVKCYAEWKPLYFHANVPLLRPANAFSKQSDVVATVFQHSAIGAYLNWERDYVTGRVLREGSDQAVFFLERRRPGVTFTPRSPAPGVTVDYPFEK